MELFEIERGTLSLRCLLADCENVAFPDFVGDRLPGPTQVALDLGVGNVQRVPCHPVERFDGRVVAPDLAGPDEAVSGMRKPRWEPMSITTRHARQLLCGEHAQQIVGLVEIAELVHQSLGVQGPNLRRSPNTRSGVGGPAKVFAEGHHGPDLEVMARESLVISGGDF